MREPVAGSYDEWAAHYPPSAHNVLMEVEQAAMVSLLPSVNGLTVLDAGCGSGRYLALMAKIGARRVIGVDSSSAMLAHARDVSTELMHANVRALPFRSETIDIVVCGLVMPDEPNLRSLLTELARVMRRGGVLLYSTLHPRGAKERWKRTFQTARGLRELPAYWHSIAEHEQECAAAGLRIDALLQPGIDNGPPVALVVRARRM